MSKKKKILIGEKIPELKGRWKALYDCQVGVILPGAVVECLDHCTVDEIRGAVEEVRNFSRIGIIAGKAEVEKIVCSQVNLICGQSTVDFIKKSTVNHVSENAYMRFVEEGSRVFELSGEARIGTVESGSEVSNLWGYAVINRIALDGWRPFSVEGDAKVLRCDR